MKNTVLNSAPEGVKPGEPVKVQVAPFGEFPGVLHGPDGDREITQVLDRAAFERVVDEWEGRGRPELLVDADHASVNGGGTAALAWAGNVRIEEDLGLAADFRFTEAGAGAVNSREYRFVSPVFICDDDGAALSLDSVALTNRPNLPVRCILNSRKISDSPARPGNPDGKTGDSPQEGKRMEKTLEALGLPPDATDEDAAAAVEALKTKAKEAEEAALNAEAEKAADENTDKIENRAEFIKLYVANGGETARAFLAAMRAAKADSPGTPPQTILNSKGAGAPQPPAVSPLREGLAKCANAAERVAYVTSHAAEFAAESK